MLNDYAERTVATLFMQHDVPPKDWTEEEGISYWQAMTPEWLLKWRDVFIPNLKKLVYERG
jgi:hypothetical protein